MVTLSEINEALLRWEETYFLEYFGITTEELVERFQDHIEEKYEQLEEEVSAEISG